MQQLECNRIPLHVCLVHSVHVYGNKVIYLSTVVGIVNEYLTASSYCCRNSS